MQKLVHFGDYACRRTLGSLSGALFKLLTKAFGRGLPLGPWLKIILGNRKKTSISSGNIVTIKIVAFRVCHGQASTWFYERFSCNVTRIYEYFHFMVLHFILDLILLYFILKFLVLYFIIT